MLSLSQLQTSKQIHSAIIRSIGGLEIHRLLILLNAFPEFIDAQPNKHHPYGSPLSHAIHCYFRNFSKSQQGYINTIRVILASKPSLMMPGALSENLPIAEYVNQNEHITPERKNIILQLLAETPETHQLKLKESGYTLDTLTLTLYCQLLKENWPSIPAVSNEVFDHQKQLDANNFVAAARLKYLKNKFSDIPDEIPKPATPTVAQEMLSTFEMEEWNNMIPTKPFHKPYAKEQQQLYALTGYLAIHVESGTITKDKRGPQLRFSIPSPLPGEAQFNESILPAQLALWRTLQLWGIPATMAFKDTINKGVKTRHHFVIVSQIDYEYIHNLFSTEAYQQINLKLDILTILKKIEFGKLFQNTPLPKDYNSELFFKKAAIAEELNLLVGAEEDIIHSRACYLPSLASSSTSNTESHNLSQPKFNNTAEANGKLKPR
jgi:hypothetical protein